MEKNKYINKIRIFYYLNINNSELNLYNYERIIINYCDNNNISNIDNKFYYENYNIDGILNFNITKNINNIEIKYQIVLII